METLEKAGLAVNYNKVPGTKPKTLPKRVHIWDETLRDGEQTPGVALTIDEKIEIAKMLDEVGTAIVAVGFPAVSDAEKKSVKAIADEGLSKAVVAAPARAVIQDIESCIDAGVEEVPIFIATSDFRLKYQLRMTREEMLERLTGISDSDRCRSRQNLCSGYSWFCQTRSNETYHEGDQITPMD